jgi:hypothetical protein
VDQLNKVLAEYGKTSGAQKATSTTNHDKRIFHDSNYGAGNSQAVRNSIANIGANAQTFNDIENAIKTGVPRKKTTA